MLIKSIIVIFILYCFSFCSLAEEQNIPEQWYVASKNSPLFHYQWCEWAKKIAEENKIYFKTYNEAVKSGKRPCHICCPTSEYKPPPIVNKPEVPNGPPPCKYRIYINSCFYFADFDFDFNDNSFI